MGALDDGVQWPLVGRAAELARVRVLVGTGGVVVAGPAGVGKTRLLREIAAGGWGAGFHVELVVASRSASSIPFGAFVRLGSHVEGDPASSLRRQLLDRAGHGRLLVVVDDGHALDPQSAALLLGLRTSGEASLVVSVRSGEREPAAVRTLWKDEWCERLELQPLGPAEIAELLAVVLDGPFDAASVRLLARASRGNALHLRELVRAGVESGALAVRHGLWSWRGPLRAPRLVELLGERLLRLGDEERHGLEVLALGEPLGIDVFVAVAGVSVAERLARAGLVEVTTLDAGTEVRLGHPLVGEVLAAELPSLVRSRLYGEMVSAVMATSVGDDGDIVRLATWQLDAGGAVDVEVLLRAADRCRFVDAELGVRLARAALRVDNTSRAALLLAHHLMLSHRGLEARGVLAGVDDESVDAATRVRLAVERANLLTWGLGEPDAAVAAIDATVDGLSGDPASARELAAHAVPMLVFAGRVREAMDRSRSMTAADGWTDGQRLRALLGEVPALVAVGRAVEAQSRAATAFALVPACEAELPAALGQLGAGYTLAEMLAGDLDGAEVLTRRGYEAGVRDNVALQRGGAALRLGQIALWRGRVRSASRYFREAITALESFDAGFLGWAADGLRVAAALGGDRDGIEDAVRVSATALRFAIYRTELARADAAHAAFDGDLARAGAVLLAGVRDAVALDHAVQVPVLCFDLSRYGFAAQAAQVIGAGGTQVEGALPEALTAAVVGIADADAGALDRVAGSFADLGVLLAAAELGSVAARIHARAGQRAASTRSACLARTFLEQCEGARTPLLVTSDCVVELTAREREVAFLASRELSDAEIAARLGLSVRTVETHLHRAYTKLAVDGRAELAYIFGETR